MRPTWASCPGTQQRRLPAAGRRRKNRHLPRRRPVQTRYKIITSDQPLGVRATPTRLRAALRIFYYCR